MARGEVTGPFVLSGATLNWHIDATMLSVGDNIDATGMAVDGNVDLVGTSTDGSLELEQASIDGELDCDHAAVADGVHASGLPWARTACSMTCAFPMARLFSMEQNSAGKPTSPRWLFRQADSPRPRRSSTARFSSPTP
jgi:hypothetical protein